MSETPDLNFQESEELFTTQDLVNENKNSSENLSEAVPSSENVENEPMEEDLIDDEHEDEEVLDGMDDDKENNTEETSENPTENIPGKKKPPSDRISTLPLAKIKHIIKLDPEVNLVSSKLDENFPENL